MSSVYKSPISKEKYANLFLDKIPEGAKNVCLLFIGHSETVHYIMSQRPEIDFTVIDGSDVTEALSYIYAGDNLKSTFVFEKSDCENDDTFLKRLKDSSKNYNTNMTFDLTLANPPYGKSSSLAQQIIDIVKACAKQSIWLVPVNTCKYDEVLKSCESVNILSRSDSNLFEGATTGRLSLLKISPKTNNSSLVYEDLILSTLDKKLIDLRKATKAYNEKMGTKSIYTIDGTYLLKKYGKTLKEASKQTLPKTFESIANRNVKDLRDEGYCFYNTVRSTVDGVHFTDGYDRRYNFEGIWDNKVDTVHSGDLLCFESKEARNNFRDWWYSCTKKYANKVECNRRGLTNMYLTLLGNCVSLSAGIGYYIDYFPQVDWSHPWTDQEILKELGLPEDFLEE